MILNFLKVAFRNIIRSKTYSIINILGLAIGLAASIIMLIYVHFETSYDKFHSKREKVFRLVMMNENYNEGGIAKIYTPAGKAIQAEVPEVENMVRVAFFGGSSFQVGEDVLEETGGYCVDPSFFAVFDFELIEGERQAVLSTPNSLVISTDMARKYFGDQSAVGETILVSNSVYDKQPFQVTGVLANVPKNSHLQFDFVAPMANLTIVDENDWYRNQGYTYLQIKEGSDLQNVEDQAFRIVRSNQSEVEEYYQSLNAAQQESFRPFILQPLSDIYLHSNLFREIGPVGNRLYVLIIASLSFFVVLMAAVNFVNLSTARAFTRAKEVGIRKATGATKGSLIRQFLSESVLVSIVALILAIGIVESALPYLNATLGLSLDLNYGELMMWIILGTLTVGLLAGVYPAFFISSFGASLALKESLRFSSKSRVRQFLVVFQFFLSVAMILFSLVVFEQVDFMKNKDLGFNKEQVITITTSSSPIKSNYEELINRLTNHAMIDQASFTGNLPGGGDWGMPFLFDGVEEQSTPNFRSLEVDENFLKTFEIELVEGRDFSSQISTDFTGAYILNKEGVKQLGWDNPLGKRVYSEALGWDGKVIGVMEDFHFRSLHESISPMLLFMQPQWSSVFSIRINGDLENVIPYVESQFDDFDSTFPFNYKIYESSLDRLYQSEDRLQYIVQIFTLLTFVIAGIGLFGLVSYAVFSRTKEFGIRKVLGASVFQIVRLVSVDFLGLILIAFCLSIPISYFAINTWLENFAYHVEVTAHVYFIALSTVLILSMLIIFQHSIRASNRNPVEALRDD